MRNILFGSFLHTFSILTFLNFINEKFVVMSLTPTGSSKRLFIAIEMPHDIRQMCKAAIHQHLLPSDKFNSSSSVAWILDEAKYHCTLRFLGEVEDTVIPELSCSLKKIGLKTAPFSIRLGNVGCFPENDVDKARIIKFGLLRETDDLDTLVENVEEAVVKLGFRRERRPYNPHVTIGRVKTQKIHTKRNRRQSIPLPLSSSLKSLLFKSSGLLSSKEDSASIRVEHITLVHSTISGSVPIYETLERYVLEG